MNFNNEAKELLTLLANSIHDRGPNISNPFVFSAKEIGIVENYLSNIIEGQLESSGSVDNDYFTSP